MLWLRDPRACGEAGRDYTTPDKEVGLPPKDEGEPQKGGTWSDLCFEMTVQGDMYVVRGKRSTDRAPVGGGSEVERRGLKGI